MPLGVCPKSDLRRLKAIPMQQVCHRLVEYWVLAFPGTGQFLGEFRVNKRGYHKIKFVDNDYEAQMFTKEEDRDTLGHLLTSMGYTVVDGSVTTTIQ